MAISRQLHRLICCRSYETARKIKQKQDEYCDRALSGDWASLGTFPDDLQWEALVDVLRGRVKVRHSVNPKIHIKTLMKVHTHGYEATDLDGLVRVCNASTHKGIFIILLDSSQMSLISRLLHSIMHTKHILFRNF